MWPNMRRMRASRLSSSDVDTVLLSVSGATELVGFLADAGGGFHFLLPSPLAGEGLGVRGRGLRALPGFPPHPQPLSRQGRGETYWNNRTSEGRTTHAQRRRLPAAPAAIPAAARSVPHGGLRPAGEPPPPDVPRQFSCRSVQPRVGIRRLSAAAQGRPRHAHP